MEWVICARRGKSGTHLGFYVWLVYDVLFFLSVFWSFLRSIDTVVAWSVYFLGCGVNVFVSSSFGYSSTARGRINRTQLMDK